MTRPDAPSRSRRTGVAATALALVVALLTVGTPLAASADELPVTGSVTGTVISATGQPIAGAPVYRYFSGQSATTDENGYFEFTGLEFASFEFGVFVDGYQSTPSQQATVSAESPTASIAFVLTPFAVGSGSISGLVTSDGAALAGQNVSAFTQSTGQNVNTVTDENGFYELTGLTNGEWSIYVYSPDHQYINLPLVTISDSSPTATLNVPLLTWPTGTAVISGTVADAQSGTPLAGINVSLQGIDVAHQSSAISDETGAFSFTALPSGSYALSSYAVGYIGATSQVRVGDGQAITASLALIPTNSTISGKVKGPNGVPVAGLYVSASSTTGASLGSGLTDANGNYVISGLGAVQYTLYVAGQGTLYVAQERLVTAVANATTVANFTLKLRKTGSLAGFVLNPDGSTHPEAVCATLYSSKSKKPIARTITAGEEFGGDGTYGFNDLKPGSYTVKFRDCDGNPATKYKKQYLGEVTKYRNATFVTVTAGHDSYENNFTLVPRGH